jgi:hypothetical protein
VTVLPFPRVRNRTFVLKHARYIASLSQQAGERYLAQQLDTQAGTMRRRGIDEPWIEDECRRLEVAIRAALWSFILRRPGGAA